MVVGMIMAIVMSALVMLLHVGEVSTGIGNDKSDLDADVRLLTGWIVRDIRQAKIQELNNNTPTTNHIKYNIWLWNNTSLSQQKTSEYVEYDYDEDAQVLTRNYINTSATPNLQGQWNFSDITMSPFYTSYTSEASNSFSNVTLLGTRRLIVAIKKEKLTRGKNINLTLVEEIRIRNE
jgi:hypothetical protein